MSDRRLRLAMAALAVVGGAIATYLTWIHYAGLDPLCFAGRACERVQSSRYAELRGVPVAVLGLAAYLTILATSALDGDAGRLGGAFVALVGVGFSAYLTYLEIAVINAICLWCVASAIVMCSLAILAVWRASLA